MYPGVLRAKQMAFFFVSHIFLGTGCSCLESGVTSRKGLSSQWFCQRPNGALPRLCRNNRDVAAVAGGKVGGRGRAGLTSFQSVDLLSWEKKLQKKPKDPNP